LPSYRWAEGRSERYAEIAAEFVRLKVDVIVTYGTPQVIAAKQATSVIPIVFALVGDPVGAGLPPITWSSTMIGSPPGRFNSHASMEMPRYRAAGRFRLPRRQI
jgi:ABC transporter substrate binding protein